MKWLSVRESELGFPLSGKLRLFYLPINFNRYFYKYTSLRALDEIAEELLAPERKNEGLLSDDLESVADTQLHRVGLC